VFRAAALCFFLAACSTPLPSSLPGPSLASDPPTPTSAAALPPRPHATPGPTRGVISPGQPLPYVVQSGDTVIAIAAHFNTTPAEVLAANPALPMTATLAPGQTITVPAYYFPLGGPTFQIIPDGEFVYGPAVKDFDLTAYLNSRPGLLRRLSAYVAGKQRSSADTLRYVAEQYSINPKLFIALMEWRSRVLTQAVPPDAAAGDNPYGLADGPRGFYLQSLWVAEQLSLGYYGWRTGALTTLRFGDASRRFATPSGYRSRVDMYQNAGTVAVHNLLAQMLPYEEFEAAAGPAGFAATYYALWGNPFREAPPGGTESETSRSTPWGPPVIPGDLTQPELALPFASNQQWSLTGGPHPGWGSNLPWSALDIAPPAGETGCIATEKWVTAAAPGVVVRTNDNTLILDLDGDGYEQTGWVLFHFHMAAHDLLPAGTRVRPGDLLGHPSCEGGAATGTHVHLARRYNGEWLPAEGIVDGVLPFVIGGWTAQKGEAPYQGRLVRLGAWVEACTCSTAANRVYWVK